MSRIRLRLAIAIVLHVVKDGRPLGLLDRYDKVIGDITPNEQTLVVAFHVEGEHAR
jgi:hypothetical protein